jgi:hypothetical protein
LWEQVAIAGQKTKPISCGPAGFSAHAVPAADEPRATRSILKKQSQFENA